MGLVIMDIVERHCVDVSELKVRVNWDQKTLQKYFPEKSVFITPEDSNKKKYLTSVRILSLIGIFLLTIFVVPYIPIDFIVDSLNEGITNASLYVGITIFGGYVFWISNQIWKRRLELSKSQGKISWKQIFSVADITPLVIIATVYIVHIRREDDPMRDSILNDPISYFINYGRLNPTPDTPYTDFVLMFLGLFTLLIFTGLCVVAIYQVWISPPTKFQKSLKNLAEKKTTFKRETTKEEEEGKFYVHTISADGKLVELWRLYNPKFVTNVFIGLTIGLFLFYMCFGIIDQALYDPETSQLLFFVSILSVGFVFVSLFFFKRFIFNPINDYYRLKKYMIKEIEARISIIYKKAYTDKDVDTILEVLYLRQCLDKHKRLPILPLDQSVSSLALLLPYIALIVSRFL